MKQKIELLAPGGNIDSVKAAIAAGADAIYLGLDRFNARDKADNFSFSDLQGIIRLAHKNNCKVFLTLNIIILENELLALVELLNKLVNTSIDGVIVQDLAVFFIVSKYFKSLEIHASTQLNTHNKGQIQFLKALNAKRVNLSRELNINEIKELTQFANQNNISTEVFVHGSYCISFSGICYMSSVMSGNSGNRGRCNQACRGEYSATKQGFKFPLNLKDNSAFFDLKELIEAGVKSLKIEGRIKKYNYVYTVVDVWRKQLDNLYMHNKLNTDNSDLYRVFNRDFTNSYLSGKIGKNMFIDNPIDYSVEHFTKMRDGANSKELEDERIKLYNEKDEVKTDIKNIIDKLSIDKCPLTISMSGNCNAPLKVKIKSDDNTFIFYSNVNLTKGVQILNSKMTLKRFKSINDTEYYIKEIDLTELEENVFIPFKEFTALKNRILYTLNNNREPISSVALPIGKKKLRNKINTSLSVLISSERDVELSNNSSANIYYQMPSGIKRQYSHLLELFSNNSKLIPYFPSILIGEDYSAAIEFLNRIEAKQIVSNNTGIAYYAYQNGIEWIAGPYLNLINSHGLQCLKENFNCSGAFISNEISKVQIQGIKAPQDFKLHFSIYHPILLMISRQCLFQTVTGCEKSVVDKDCIPFCNKHATITNTENETFFINKSEGNNNCIYKEENYLNTDIISSIPNMFSNFLIDLRDVNTGTKTEVDKASILALFEKLLTGDNEAEKTIHQVIRPSTKKQYERGI